MSTNAERRPAGQINTPHFGTAQAEKGGRHDLTDGVLPAGAMVPYTGTPDTRNACGWDPAR
jgi:hypothetical protein